MSQEFQLNGKVDMSDPTRPIVMVDDEELDFISANRAYKRSTLTNPFQRYENGLDFLDYLLNSKKDNAPLPALVLMDINMPRMNGFEVVKKLREDSYFLKVPIVAMLTSSTDKKDRERAVEVGADTYFVKPYNPKTYTAFFNSLAPQ